MRLITGKLILWIYNFLMHTQKLKIQEFSSIFLYISLTF